jgi:hypothetical protein
MKKIILFVFLFFSFLSINYSFADESEKDEAKAKYIDDCKVSKNCIDQPSFVIKTWDISPWIVGKWNTSSEIANWALWTIIQKMMLALWFLSVFIMTVWAWYIVLHNWQDELLSKWKTIFMSWIYAMIIALSSYYLVAAVRFLLYSTTNN